jgi:predicted Fe-Mo cluster-binding NifX family protein
MSTNETSPFSGKIAVATNDQKRVTGHIGRCRTFKVFEIDKNKIVNTETRANQFTNHQRGGEHHHHGEGHGNHSHTHLIEGLKDCSYLISSGGGWRVVEDLKQNDIITLFTDVDLIDDAVYMFLNGELKHEVDLECRHD